MADVNDFLAMSPDDIPETITLPEGSYDFVITSYRTDRVGENQNQIVRLNCKAQAVLESDITDDIQVNHYLLGDVVFMIF